MASRYLQHRAAEETFLTFAFSSRRAVNITHSFRFLNPVGLVLMRDYGRHDLTQLGFKAGWLDENVYIRGDSGCIRNFE